MPTQKISFMVPPGLWQSFKDQTDRLFINRAPFLSYMIASELPHIRKDLQDRILSTPAKRYIAGMVKKQGAKSVNIEIDSNTAAALKQVVAEHNLVRDALICRLIIFLRGKDALLRWLDIPTKIGGLWSGTHLESMSVSPMSAMEEIHSDPLYYIRNYVSDEYGCDIYTVTMPPSLDWAACYLDDSSIPIKDSSKRQPDLSFEFEAFESKILSTSKGRKRK